MIRPLSRESEGPGGLVRTKVVCRVYPVSPSEDFHV